MRTGARAEVITADIPPSPVRERVQDRVAAREPGNLGQALLQPALGSCRRGLVLIAHDARSDRDTITAPAADGR